ncbi:hypothetical protein [Myxococcus sp. Y35]|uniref:hypothetical protein n=1 Tax=Pseudomyxococcus flavus TaxID=3115648 RepID=UPI003CF435F2
MELSPEVAVVMFAASNVVVPVLNGLFSRRQAKHEAAVDQVPLLLQQVANVAADVKDIKADLRRVGEHESALKLVDLRLKGVETWQSEARPQLERAVRESHLLMGERNARQLQQSANLVDPQKVARSPP